MKHFIKGFIFGTVTTSSVFAGAILSFKKKVIEPIENEEIRLEENRKRATRKSRSSHQG